MEKAKEADQFITNILTNLSNALLIGLSPSLVLNSSLVSLAAIYRRNNKKESKQKKAGS